MESLSPVSITAAVSALSAPWQPHDLVVANGAAFRVAKLEGDFPWHHHDEDEVFLCWDGSFRIEMEGYPPVALGPGDLFVVPRGTRHRPVAEGTAHALLLERIETQQYGN
jgi:mannose-6-phosphate isomerase-like protein (cupin superfamily)